MERKRLQRPYLLRKTHSREYKTLLAREHRLRGKYVVIVGNRVFTAKSGKEAARLLSKVRKEFPTKTPLATFVPKEETLILWL